MKAKDQEGNPKYGQYDIHYETGLSRPYLRKLAREIGHQFPRNGVEVIGVLCMCSNCGTMFRKAPSRVKRATHQFCDQICREAWFKGANHPSWKTGKSAATFSTWVKNQQQYKDFVAAVLERDNYTCQISGKTDDLAVHHIFMKAEQFNPEKAFEVSNGITVNVDVHKRIHQLIREGLGFEQAVEKVRSEYE
jgi:5-methylcytosine-specific restriction endonuclease McrA